MSLIRILSEKSSKGGDSRKYDIRIIITNHDDEDDDNNDDDGGGDGWI